MLRRLIYAVLIVPFLFFSLIFSAICGWGDTIRPLQTKPWALLVDEPARGVFLVAGENMPDPRFRGAVILILDHGEEGTLGVIINHPTSIKLSEALPDLETTAPEHRLFIGGPVSMDRMLLLARNDKAWAGTQHVIADIYWSTSRATLETMLGQNTTGATLRIYLGHSGWAPGQLAAEITEDSWYLFKADPDIVFHENLHTLWEWFFNQRSIRWVDSNPSFRERLLDTLLDASLSLSYNHDSRPRLFSTGI